MAGDPAHAGRIDVAARTMMAVLFLASGAGKLARRAATEAYMREFGVPVVLRRPAAALELGGGVLLILGAATRPLARMLAFWCVLTAAIFHRRRQDPVQQVMFLKNLTMAGGFLILSVAGATHASLDGVFARRRAQAVPLARVSR